MADAVVHEWLDARRGSELVFEAIAASRPDAELYALSAAPDHGIDTGGRTVSTTFLDRPAVRERRSLTLPLMPLAWRAVARAKRFDTVVVSHHANAAQFARYCEAERRLAYVHTPARYVWSPELDERGASPALAPIRALLKRTDRRAAEALDSIAANSSEVARRIEHFWDRSAFVIHPPVATTFFRPAAGATPTRDYLLGFSRFVGYKRLDLVIAIGERVGMPVVIAGGGPEEASLRARAAMASVPVDIVIRPDDERLRELYRNAACLVFPAHEDFGIVPVEAQACGTPVVALAAGGALETVLDGVTGFLVSSADLVSFADAIADISSIRSDECVAWAARFSAERFRAEITSWLGGSRS